MIIDITSRLPGRKGDMPNPKDPAPATLKEVPAGSLSDYQGRPITFKTPGEPRVHGILTDVKVEPLATTVTLGDGPERLLPADTVATVITTTAAEAQAELDADTTDNVTDIRTDRS